MLAVGCCPFDVVRMQGVWGGNVDGFDLRVLAERFKAGIAGDTKVAFKLRTGEGLWIGGAHQLQPWVVRQGGQHQREGAPQASNPQF